MKFIKSCYLFTFPLFLIGCATAGAELQAQAKQDYASLRVEHFRSLMIVKDDELETSAQFSTFEGYRPVVPTDPYRALLVSSTENYRNDEFIRAYIHKENGDETFQMYFMLRGNEWNRPREINFTAGLGSKPTQSIGIDVSCNVQFCNRDEDVIVSFTRLELERVVQNLQVSSEVLLKFRVKGRTGKDYDGSFSISEIEAILTAVKTYKSKK